MDIRNVLLVFLMIAKLTHEATRSDTATQLDVGFLNSFFRSTNGLNIIKFGYQDPIIKEGLTLGIFRKTPATLNEQCIIECFKFANCFGYTFENSNKSCKIYLSRVRRQQFDQNTLAKIKELLKIDYDKCGNAIYCMDDNESKDLGTNQQICDISNTGKRCEYNVTYEYSAWSKWTSCSTTCDSSFRKRNRNCLRNVYDENAKRSLKVNTTRFEMCQISSNDAQIEQVEKCIVPQCRLLADWSSWSPCNSLRNGLSTRQRNCTSNQNSEICSPLYLTESKQCGFGNFGNTMLGKD